MPPRGPKRKQRKHLAKSSPLDKFFADYPGFDYDASNSASHEFYRMCDEFGWGRNNARRQGAHEDFKDALVKQFNEAYGTDENNLGNWQGLCHIVQIDPVPDELHACREAVRRTYVNLVDLVDADSADDVQVFDSELELSQYTKNTGKFFPRENAYAGGLLKYLLRHIFHPATKVSARGRAKGRHQTGTSFSSSVSRQNENEIRVRRLRNRLVTF